MLTKEGEIRSVSVERYPFACGWENVEED